MPRLKSANFAVTELAAGINDTVTGFVVDDASAFPDAGPFMILVHDRTPGFAGVREIMEVGTINKGTNTFSDVLRGREGASAVAHDAGARVECVWTAGTHEELADGADHETHLSDYAKHGELIAFPGFYIVTEFDTPNPGDITETMRKSIDDSVFLTKITEFDIPAAGNITITAECASLSIHNKVVTEFDVPDPGKIKETASEVV